MGWLRKRAPHGAVGTEHVIRKLQDLGYHPDAVLDMRVGEAVALVELALDLRGVEEE